MEIRAWRWRLRIEFDAIVLDIGLPGRSGYSITAHSAPPLQAARHRHADRA